MYRILQYLTHTQGQGTPLLQGLETFIAFTGVMEEGKSPRLAEVLVCAILQDFIILFAELNIISVHH